MSRGLWLVPSSWRLDVAFSAIERQPIKACHKLGSYGIAEAMP
jgi:hypothetical protein